MEPLYHLTNIDYDENSLIEEAKKYEDVSPTYYDPRYQEYTEGWKIIKDPQYALPQAKKVSKQFLLENLKIRYYILERNIILPIHTDNNTQCSINIILSKDYSPITVNGDDYYYKSCILNTTLPHGVKNLKDKRYLLKFTIMDKSFEECVNHLKTIGVIEA